AMVPVDELVPPAEPHPASPKLHSKAAALKPQAARMFPFIVIPPTAGRGQGPDGTNRLTFCLVDDQASWPVPPSFDGIAGRGGPGGRNRLRTRFECRALDSIIMIMAE